MQFTKENGIAPKRAFVILIGLLVLGALFRFYGLGFQSLWTDELASWDISSRESLAAVIDETIENDHYPPGYYILLHYVIKYLGDSEAMLRMPSAIAGLLCIIALYFLGSRLYSNKEGLIASAIMAVLWCPIYYSQEARAYIFLLLFSILSIYYWIPIVEDLKNNLKPNKRDIIFYVVYSSLCCYTHYFGGYFIALQGFGSVVLFLRKKSAWGSILLIYACIVIAFGPWIPVFFGHFKMGSSALAIAPKPISLIYLLKFIGFVFNAQKSTFVPVSSYSTVDVIISTSIILLTTSLIVSLAAIKFYNYFIGKKSKVNTQHTLDPELLLYCWLVIPFLGLYMTRKIPKFDYYYLLISLPPAYLLISKSISTLFTKPKIQALVAVVFCVVSVIHLIYDKKYYSEPNKEQFREAVQYAVENDRRYPESKIIGYTFDRFFDYYLKRNGSAKRVDLYINDEKGVISKTDKIDLIDKKYLWLISAHLTPDEKFINCLLKDYKIIHSQNFILANVWLFEKLYPERAVNSSNLCLKHYQSKRNEKQKLLPSFIDKIQPIVLNTQD